MPESVYPFSAVVGQQMMKKAILLSIINPRLSPVLIRGFRGTAKGTILKSLPELVPDIEVVSGCQNNCAPADRDNFCPDCRGRASLGMIESRMQPMPVLQLSQNYQLFTKSSKRLDSWASEFKALSSAHRGILAVDKINLYGEKTVDSLLNFAIKGFKASDSARSSSFALIATINIEDGDISPAALDRFVLQVNVRDITDIEERIEITKRMIEFKKSPASFRSKFRQEQEKLGKMIVRAREDVPKVECPPKVKDVFPAICKKFKLGRMEAMLEQTAITNAAYEGKKYISLDDVMEILDITVPHKL